MILLFNNKEKLIRVIKSEAVRVADHTQVLTDENYISDRVYIETTALSDKVLNELEYLALPVKGKDYQYYYFWVQKHSTEGDITTIQGVQSGIEDLRKSPIYDERPTNRPASQAIEQVLKDTNWTAGYVSDTGKNSIRLYYVDVFTALKRICERWGLEMQFFIEVTHDRITARYINFKTQIGVNNGQRVVYGHNALEILKEEEKTELYTALIGRGRGEEVSDGSESESGQAGYGRKINFAEVEWSKAKGDPVDKPKGQRYVEIPEASQLYGIVGGKPKVGFIDFEEEEDPENLLRLTYQELERVSRPQVTFKTSAVYVDGQIGDTVRVVRPDKMIDYNTRIFEITWDRLADRATDIKLGDRIGESPNKRESRITSNAVSQALEEAGRQTSGLIDRVLSANGFNTNFYTKEDPFDLGYDVKVGDLWFRPDPDSEGDTILYFWNGEYWEEIIRTRDWAVVDNAIKEANKALEEFIQKWTEIQERNDKELADFEDSLSQIRDEIDKLEESGITPEQIDEALARAGFSKQQIEDIQSDIDGLSEEVKKSLASAGFNRKQIADVQADLAKTSDGANLALDMIGRDGITRYNRNRAEKPTSGEIEFRGDPIEVRHNGPGFQAGQTYTISFNAICEPMEQVSVLFNFLVPDKEVEFHFETSWH